MSIAELKNSYFALILFSISTFIYLNTFNAGYTWDDRAAIVSLYRFEVKIPFIDWFRIKDWQS